jgi:hypothetical protein
MAVCFAVFKIQHTDTNGSTIVVHDLAGHAIVAVGVVVIPA